MQAKCWRECIDRSVELTKVHRQNDPIFIAMLQQIRLGRYVVPNTTYCIVEFFEVLKFCECLIFMVIFSQMVFGGVVYFYLRT